MTDDRDMARLEAKVELLQSRLATIEQAGARNEERLSNHKDRIEKIETGQRNVVMAVIGIVITAVLRTIGFAK